MIKGLFKTVFLVIPNLIFLAIIFGILKVIGTFLHIPIITLLMSFSTFFVIGWCISVTLFVILSIPLARENGFYNVVITRVLGLKPMIFVLSMPAIFIYYYIVIKFKLGINKIISGVPMAIMLLIFVYYIYAGIKNYLKIGHIKSRKIRKEEKAFTERLDYMTPVGQRVVYKRHPMLLNAYSSETTHVFK